MGCTGSRFQRTRGHWNPPAWCALVLGFTLLSAAAFATDDRPNILWLTSEDNGPHLGCYGDPNASTPNLDRLADEGFRYRVAWSNAPVCAPARAAIITGMHPSSLGTEPMRTAVEIPFSMRLLPEYVREAGYYCTNNGKTDYNLALGREVWDESSGSAHWRNRGTAQPFFAVFNFMTTHESMIRFDFGETQRDPATIDIPPYHPDTPETRLDWARYYDRLSAMDAQIGERLRELEEAGLADSTIVVYFGDHGAGMPRSKRAPYDSGLHVPLIVRIPERFRHLMPSPQGPGNVVEDLVSFVDLAPTVIEWSGAEVPMHLQGRSLPNRKERTKTRYLYGSRSRTDERFDLVRTLRDERFIYIRNYMPHRPHGQHVNFQFRTRTTQVWYQQYLEDGLSEASARFWKRRPSEELYDLANDPHELHNLAADPEHAVTLERFRRELEDWTLRSRDVGYIPEPDLYTLYADQVPWEIARDEALYPLELIRKVASLASSNAFEPKLISYLDHDNATVRYWAFIGLLNHVGALSEPPIEKVRSGLADPSPSVRVISAEVLAWVGTEEDRAEALQTLLVHSDLNTHHFTVVNFALNSLDYLGAKAASVSPEIENLPSVVEHLPGFARNYTRALILKTLEDLKSGKPTPTSS